MENPEKTKGAVKNGKSRETRNIGYKTKIKDRQNKKHNTVCVGRHYTQTATIPKQTKNTTQYVLDATIPKQTKNTTQYVMDATIPKQTKNTTQYVMDATMPKQTQIPTNTWR